jgi:phage tail tube protein FII
VIGKCTSGEKLNFTKLVATKYQLRLVVDENQDGKWTPGNYSENKQPEKVFYYPEEINLRANWELEIDF